MRFCPKCSLRIKANIAHCPICKVELLSCAEDEAAAAESLQEGQNANTENSTDLSEAAGPAGEKTSTPPAFPSPPSPQSSVNDADLAQTVKQLVSQLESIEKNLALITGREDVVKKSIVDLEAKLNKLEKQMVNLQAVSPERFEALEKEVARSALATTAPSSGEEGTSGTPPPARGTMEAPKSFSGAASPQSFSAAEHAFSDEGPSFSKDDTDDFSPVFQSTDSTFEQNRALPSEKSPKKKVPLLIPLLALAMIAVWLLFYYLRPQPQTQTAIVTEQVTPQPPVQSSAPSTGQTAETPDGAAGLPGSMREGSPNLPEPAVKSPPVPQAPPPAARAPTEKKPLFTVNVGSFKDKNLATALTARLRDNGYTALMSQSGDSTFYRVRVGAFPTVDEARTYALNLQKKEKLPTFVTRLDQP